MRIVFLDFDGVLNTAPHMHVLGSKKLQSSDEFGPFFDPTSVSYLKQIIDETNVKIVVTSSWKYLMTYQDLLIMWGKRTLPGEIIDACPIPEGRRKRGDEIDAWLSECKESCQYVILDDMSAANFNEHQLEHLIVVNPYYGIEQETVERALAILNARRTTMVKEIIANQTK